ncbi:MAG: hypothetical protein BGP01_06200 [Paludibacter sp. 47-17]|nr:MAG: hypothetical protein BGP01_06200 [Paludibacter sp. 47-17]
MISLPSSFLHNPILLNIGLARHVADWNYSNVNSPFLRIYLVMEGEAWLSINGKKYKLTPGNLYLIPPYTVHDDACDGRFMLYYIHVYENNDTNLSVFEEFDFPVEIAATELEELIVKRLLEINPGFELRHYDPHSYSSEWAFFSSIARRQSLEPYVLMQTKGIINQLFSCFLKQAVQTNLYNDSRVYKAAQYIREHLHTKLLLKNIAGYCNISEDYLIRLFKRDLQMTPVAYINKKRIEKAQLKLIDENVSIKNIAYSLAFDNLSYFNRVFKNIVGKTPSEYIRCVQEADVLKT